MQAFPTQVIWCVSCFGSKVPSSTKNRVYAILPPQYVILLVAAMPTAQQPILPPFLVPTSHLVCSVVTTMTAQGRRLIAHKTGAARSNPGATCTHCCVFMQRITRCLACSTERRHRRGLRSKVSCNTSLISRSAIGAFRVALDTDNKVGPLPLRNISLYTGAIIQHSVSCLIWIPYRQLCCGGCADGSRGSVRGAPRK